MSLVMKNVVSASGRRTSIRLNREEWEALAEVSQRPNLSQNQAIDAFVQSAERERPLGVDRSRTEAVRSKLTAELLAGWRIATDFAAKQAINDSVETRPRTALIFGSPTNG
jgi:predicted DNA-binding ribbon-helix-helix protein